MNAIISFESIHSTEFASFCCRMRFWSMCRWYSSASDYNVNRIIDFYWNYYNSANKNVKMPYNSIFYWNVAANWNSSFIFSFRNLHDTLFTFGVGLRLFFSHLLFQWKKFCDIYLADFGDRRSPFHSSTASIKLTLLSIGLSIEYESGFFFVIK